MSSQDVTVPRGVGRPEPFEDLEPVLDGAAALARIPAPIYLSDGEELLDGRLQIEARIGRGGMGSVYRAHDRERKKSVALRRSTICRPRS
jgi:hypothetical protein